VPVVMGLAAKQSYLKGQPVLLNDVKWISANFCFYLLLGLPYL
jgi:hypothetical protein